MRAMEAVLAVSGLLPRNEAVEVLAWWVISTVLSSAPSSDSTMPRLKATTGGTKTTEAASAPPT
jgi:hypothetical protein